MDFTERITYQLLKAILAALKLISVPAAEIAWRECLIEGHDHNEYNYIPLNSDDIPPAVSGAFLSSSSSYVAGVANSLIYKISVYLHPG